LVFLIHTELRCTVNHTSDLPAYLLNVFYQCVYVVRRTHSHRWSIFVTPLHINLTSVCMPDFEARGQAMCSSTEQFQRTGRNQITYRHFGHVQMYNTKRWRTYYMISYSLENRATSVSKSNFIICFQLEQNFHTTGNWNLTMNFGLKHSYIQNQTRITLVVNLIINDFSTRHF